MINQNYYNLNATRGYPIDDAATAVDDAGQPIPAGIIVDACVRFPESLGKFVYLSAINVSDRAVSVCLNIGTTLDDATLRIVASLSRSAAIIPGRHYPIQSLVSGVGGWLVFGDLSTVRYSGRCSTAAQSRLCIRTARPYAPLPIPSVQRENDARTLSQVVRLLSGTDIEIVRQPREINGVLRENVIVFRLTGDPATVLQRYTGPCGGRPESNTCKTPPVEQINDVVPDAAGNINIVADGLDLAEMEAGVELNTALTVVDLCQQSGYAPGGPPPESDCPQDEGYDGSIEYPPFEPGPGGETPGGDPEEPPDPPDPEPLDYPVCIRFDNGAAIPLATPLAGWQFGGLSPLAPLCQNWADPVGTFRTLQRTINTGGVALFDDELYIQNRDMEAETAFLFAAATLGSAGLVADYRLVAGVPNYWVVMLTRQSATTNAGILEIRRFNGTAFEVAIGSAAVQLPINTHFRINLKVLQNLTNPSRVDFKVTLRPLSGLPSILNVPNVGSYGSSDGKFGIWANRSSAHSSYFTLVPIDD